MLQPEPERRTSVAGSNGERNRCVKASPCSGTKVKTGFSEIVPEIDSAADPSFAPPSISFTPAPAPAERSREYWATIELRSRNIRLSR